MDVKWVSYVDEMLIARAVLCAMCLLREGQMYVERPWLSQNNTQRNVQHLQIATSQGTTFSLNYKHFLVFFLKAYLNILLQAFFSLKVIQSDLHKNTFS